MSAQEFEKTPVTPEQLQPARYFAASYAGEHVAGTEFVIGAMFVAWGVPTMDILWGLLWGNTLAVLTWGLVCAPIATDTRLTLYAYLEKIAGPGTIRLYSVVNGVLFCVLAGTMITVSASAVRILFDIPAQVLWYPTSASFVLVAVAVGALVVTIAALGFRRVAQFAEVCAPWMVLMFVVGALALLPSLVASTPGLKSIGSFADFRRVADMHIWSGDGTGLNVWHVAAFAWVCNLAMHGGLGDMTLLRFARSSTYGYFSALGMFIGHYLAWVCAGIMGAGAALALGTTVTQLDAGAVAFQALGAAGIVTVIIAGWTTSNPTLYRAGLAFQSLNHDWDRVRVTIITGVVTTVIACFPFVFSKLMDFVGLMGLILAPLGAVIVTEHWLFPRLGLTRYWASYSGQHTNRAAVAAWVISLLAAFLLNRAGLHLFFLLVPTWIVATLAYVLLASRMGAREPHAEAVRREEEAERERKREERNYLARPKAATGGTAPATRAGLGRTLSGLVALLALASCLGLGIAVLAGADLDLLRRWLLLPSLVYFIAGTLWARQMESGLEGGSPG